MTIATEFLESRAELLTERRRWTSGLKAALLDGIDQGIISLEDVDRVHGIDASEIVEWRHRRQEHGVAGLKATKRRAAA